jgi:hypothetical protein
MQKRIYLDSVTIIYLLENTAKRPAVLSVLSKYPNHTKRPRTDGVSGKARAE